MDDYYQGESIPLTLTVVDDDGNAIDLDTLDDIEVKVFNKSTREVMNTFTLSGGTVTKTNAPNGVCDVVNDGSTTDIRTGVYVAQVKTEETDADYSPKRYRYGQVDAFILKQSI